MPSSIVLISCCDGRTWTRTPREDFWRIEPLYPEWNTLFTRILAEGAPEHWELEWKK
jgi:hypothetical protein